MTTNSEQKELIDELGQENSQLKTVIEGLEEEIESLKNEHARERRAIKGSNDGLFDRPLDNGNTWVSEQWQKTFRFEDNSRHEFSEFEKRVHPQDKNRFKAALTKAVKSYQDMKKLGQWEKESTVYYECDYRVLPYSHEFVDHKSTLPNEYLWVRAVGRVSEDESGNAHLSGGHSNISDEKARHEAFELWEYIYKRIIHADPNMIYIKRGDHHFVFANEAVAELYGATLDSIVDHSDEEFSLTGEQREICWNDDDRILNGVEVDGAHFWPETIQRDELLTGVDGKSRWYRTAKKPIKIGGERHVLGISTDITDTVTARDELQKIIDQVPIPIHTKTSHLRYDIVNASFVRLASEISGRTYSVKDITGKTAREVYGDSFGEFSKRIEEIDKECIASGSHNEFQNLPYSDGRTVKSQFIRIARENGGLLGVTIDVAEQERESQIQSMEALTTVFRTLSHSLLDVVTEGVKRSVNVSINDEDQLDRTLNALDFLQSYTFRLKILETTLDQNGDVPIESLPGYELDPQPIKLVELAGRARDIIVNFCPEIPIENEIDPDVEVSCDHHLLQMVLIEMLHNSLKYTKGSLPESPVKISSLVKNGFIEIAVSDCGAGPAKDVDTKDWFKPFMRFTPPGYEDQNNGLPQNRPDGTGFGLYFSDLIVKSHGGNFFDPVSNDRNGTTVMFRLPKMGDTNE